MSDRTDQTPEPWEGATVTGETMRRLPVHLTEDERAQRGRELALQARAVDDLEIQQKLAMKAFREAQAEALSDAKDERRRLMRAVNTGEEPRPVRCVKLADYGRGVMYTVRKDTSVTVDTRRLTENEVQVQAPIPIRLVRDDSGKMRREDGGDVDALPTVLKSQCEPVGCRDCGTALNHPHDDECDLRGVGKAALVAEDQLDPLACADCGVEVGGMHAESCQHFEGGEA